MPSQNVSDGFVANLDAQFGKLPCDFEVASVLIFVCQSHNEPFNSWDGTRTSALVMGLTGPFAAN